jgi:uncharacterized protein YndB with AHSA1/START domain
MSWHFQHTFTVPATAHDIFAALTTPSALQQWFAESVDIGVDVNGAYRFWGRHSLDTPTADTATQHIVTWIPGKDLAFSWNIAGVDTQVAIQIAEQPAKGEESDQTCLVTVRHDISDTLPLARERELIEDHWRLAIGNLMSYLAGGSGIVLPDYTDPAPVVHLHIDIQAPRDVVFRALTTPSLVNQWLGSTTTIVEPHQGGRFEVGWKYQVDGRDVVGGPTRILEYVENERLTLDWPDWRGDTTVTGQTITFVLHEHNGGTRVEFTHAGFTRTTDISDYPFGWLYFLGALRDVTVQSLTS